VTEILIATAVLAVVIGAGLFYLRGVPLGLLMIVASIAAAVAAGFGFPFRHLVEGTFTYFHIVLICATGVIFLKSLEDTGAAAVMTRSIVVRFHRWPVVLITMIMLLLLVPGMLTGIAINSVLSVGVLVAPIMIGMGIPRITTAVIIGIGAILSMTIPPTNLLAMLIAQGINAPFVGFELPMVALSVPLAILTGLILGLPHMRRVALEKLLEVMPADAGFGTFRAWLPLLVVVGILLGTRAFPGAIPDIGTPFTFVIGTAIAALAGKRINVIHTARAALSGPMLGILEILVGVGVVVQIATLTGVRGLLVVGSLSLPDLMAYPVSALSLMLTGGMLSPFGASSIFGVPFALFFLEKNQIIVITALALLAALSQFMPPTAIAGRSAAQVAGVDEYRKVWRASLIPVLIILVIGIVVIAFADPIGRLLT
jgi:gluconate:H+ symporter, GntP family